MEGLTKCPECASEVPDEAEVCARCGHAFRGGRRWRRNRNRRALVLLAVVVVAAGVFLGLYQSAIDSSERNACEENREFLDDIGVEPSSDC